MGWLLKESRKSKGEKVGGPGTERKPELPMARVPVPMARAPVPNSSYLEPKLVLGAFFFSPKQAPLHHPGIL